VVFAATFSIMTQSRTPEIFAAMLRGFASRQLCRLWTC
jgi:hypothetical protein